jgi:N-acetylmuramoyl-L-alanine amidase
MQSGQAMVAFDKFSGQFIDAVTMGAAAKLTNGERNAGFWRRLNGSYSGPRVFAEGDSWFCYPAGLVANGPSDVVHHLSRPYAVATQATPGALLQNMRDTLFNPGGLLTALDQFEIDVLILSGGGNDLLGGGRISTVLNPGVRPLPEYFNDKYGDYFWDVFKHLEHIVETVRRERPSVQIVLHGYDHARPVSQGPWLGGPMAQLGIPKADQQAIVKRIVNHFNTAQKRFARQVNERATREVVFCANVRDLATEAWFDEIHPSSLGFGKVAAEIGKRVAAAYRLRGRN